MVNSFFVRVQALGAIIALLLFPVTTWEEVPILVIPFAVMYLAMGIGGYKIALPFVGR